MQLSVLKGDFSVCKVKTMSEIDFANPFVFVSKTDEELSLVCETSSVPETVIVCEPGWKALRIEEQLDFSLLGILAKISTVLAEQKIGIFVISTFNTDYILVKSTDLELAILALQENGYEFVL